MLEIIYRYDPGDKQTTNPRPADALQALDKLSRGNQWFCGLLNDEQEAPRQGVIPIDLGTLGVGESIGTAPKHSPFAAILSCSDARTPIELIFGQGVNDLFSVRLAGNVTTIESVGSLNYAARHLGGSVKLMVVLGHTGCGAVTAAVDVYLDPTNIYELTNTLGLRSVVEPLFVAVRIAAKALDQVADVTDSDFKERLTNLAVTVNAAVAAMTLRQLLGDAIPDDCLIVYGVCDIATRKVSAYEPGVDSAQRREICLAEPPTSYALLEELALWLAQGS